VRLSFTLRDLPGRVDVSVEPNAAPEALGCPPHAEGFPVCTASVEYAGRGYAGALGWIQVVRSSDGEGSGERFELDPFEPLGPTTHPFCWFGFGPTLFDAPSRVEREPLQWVAHRFLGFIADEGHEARAVVGFDWGFSIADGVISIAAPGPLGSDAWDVHLPLLRHEHPGWGFAAGYRDR
jgi:hypothetical protein